MDDTYDKVNKAWKDTCRILLSEEIGELKDYEKYLQKTGADPPIEIKSELSNQKVYTFSTNIKNSKVISGNELQEYNTKMSKKKIDINKIKDIDSLLEEIEELYYAGNIIQGNSNSITRSDKITDASYIYESSIIKKCKYTAYSTNVLGCDHTFGTIYSTNNQFAFRNVCTYNIIRSMEIWWASIDNSDCYYCGNIMGCKKCMFSFGQKSMHNVIGNNQLTVDKYSKIKEYLLEDIRNTLKAKHNAPSLIDIMERSHNE